MIVQCDKCGTRFEDVYRSTLCPHAAFPANDGNNVFTVHEDSYIEEQNADTSETNETSTVTVDHDR
jgi:predicted  nucleic acid-binding Zn-ribbon protein